MTISERIFERLAQLSMTQKEFSERTGILPSTISEWKKNKTNPTSEKIIPICETLGVTPDWLLSGLDQEGGILENRDYFTVKKDSEIGRLIAYYNCLNPGLRGRVMGYAEAYAGIEKGAENGDKSSEG